MKLRFDLAKPLQVGGQAVIEGVMMRAPGMVATVVRKGENDIRVRKEPYVSLAEKNKVFKLPVLRGAVGLVEMLVIGVKTLNFSAEIAAEEEGAGRGHGTENDGTPGRSRLSVALAVTLVLSLIAGVAIFFVTPLLVTTAFFKVEQDPLLFNLVAGTIRIAMLILYLALMSSLKDIRRVFEYHGAEHKAVFAFERGEPLNVEAAARQSRFHPRCGTSFVLLVMFVAVVSFALLDALLISSWGEITLTRRLLTHLPLIPVIGGVAYEAIKASAKRSTSVVGRIVVAPGLWLQRITTREPDEGQLEVALVALRSALGEEEISSVSNEEPPLREASAR